MLSVSLTPCFTLSKTLEGRSHSGCPEECREAIASLIVDAATFSDLSELRDLRQIFQERYGNSLECYVNQEITFAASLNPKSFTLEQKVCLMQEISSKFSIRWDSKAFELRMSKSSAFAQGHNTYKPDHSVSHNKPLQGKDEVLLAKSPDYFNKDAASTTERIRSDLNNFEQDLQATRNAQQSKQSYEKELHDHEYAREFPVLKPKSVWRKHSKSRSTHNDATKEDSDVANKSRSRRRDESRRGLQILFDDEPHKKDEDERVIDRLLMHYSKKPSSIAGPEKARRRFISRHAHEMDDGPDKTLFLST